MSHQVQWGPWGDTKGKGRALRDDCVNGVGICFAVDERDARHAGNSRAYHPRLLPLNREKEK